MNNSKKKYEPQWHSFLLHDEDILDCSVLVEDKPGGVVLLICCFSG